MLSTENFAVGREFSSAPESIRTCDLRSVGHSDSAPDTDEVIDRERTEQDARRYVSQSALVLPACTNTVFNHGGEALLPSELAKGSERSRPYPSARASALCS